MRKQTLLLSVMLLLLTVSLVVIAPLTGLAQSDAGACPALVEQALTDMGQNCDLLDRNSACYGYNRVDATFHQSTSDDFFSKPADRSQIANLQSIATAPLDVDQDFWGIAVMNVQANVPNTLPGQAVTFVLLGDVKVDNAVNPEDAAEPVEPISVMTTIAANIRSGPSTNANVLGSITSGTELMADGVNSDQTWLRVLFESGPGWISREVLQAETDVSGLPIISSENRSPMQSFFFTTGVGDPACNAAPPSLLVVQGPDNVKVDITANGADISIGSTIALMILPGNTLQLVVIHGEATLGNISVPAGFKISAQLSEDGKTVVGNWEQMSPLTAEDLALLQPLENLPTNILHYAIELPTLEEIQATINLFLQTNANANTNGTTQSAAAGANGVDCGPFRATSPLDGLPFGDTTFYWDPAPGATSYQVNLFNDSGTVVGSFETSAPNSSLVGDTSGMGNGFSFGWQVVALVNGQVACSSPTITMFRSSPPAPIEPQASPVAIETEIPEWSE